MLAATMFMALVGMYTSRKDICLLRLSDNEEFINPCAAHQSYRYPYPNATTKGEFDVVEKITRSSERYSIGGNFKWVKGHQDDDKNAELSIEALLNIEADALAGSYKIGINKTDYGSPCFQAVRRCSISMALASRVKYSTI